MGPTGLVGCERNLEFVGSLVSPRSFRTDSISHMVFVRNPYARTRFLTKSRLVGRPQAASPPSPAKP